MMNDDDYGGRGLSGAAGYMLGRMAAESDHDRTRFYERVRQRFARPQRVPYDAAAVESAIESWKDAVRGRDHTIARLKGLLNDASAAHEALRQRDASAHEENNRLREQIARHEHDIALLQNSIMTLHHQHNEKVARLDAEITHLKIKS
mgnify:CR=1 FL=1